jgi:hypothetical protein
MFIEIVGKCVTSVEEVKVSDLTELKSPNP